jgi:small subunit ribosomal protein S6
MTLPAPTYDLVLLLDPQAEEPTRTKLVADTRSAIEAQGELLRHDEWGERALAYPIDRKASAIYHLFQFHVGETALLDGLDRTLRIADEAIRFRIIKLAPGVPPAPDMSAGASARRSDGEAAAPAPASAPAPAASAPAPDAAPAGESAPAADEAAPAEVAAPAADSSAPAVEPASEIAVGDPS